MGDIIYGLMKNTKLLLTSFPRGHLKNNKFQVYHLRCCSHCTTFIILGLVAPLDTIQNFIIAYNKVQPVCDLYR